MANYLSRGRNSSGLLIAVLLICSAAIFLALGITFMILTAFSASVSEDPKFIGLLGPGTLIFAALINFIVYGLVERQKEIKQKKKESNPMGNLLTDEEIAAEKKEVERQRAIEEKEKKKETEERLELYKQVLKIAEQEKPVKQPVVRRKPPSVVSKELIKNLTYKEQLKEEKCSICKLELRKNQEILQCPECHVLFHKEHLVEWLETKKDCPVCHIEIRK